MLSRLGPAHERPARHTIFGQDAGVPSPSAKRRSRRRTQEFSPDPLCNPRRHARLRAQIRSGDRHNDMASLGAERSHRPLSPTSQQSRAVRQRHSRSRRATSSATPSARTLPNRCSTSLATHAAASASRSSMMASASESNPAVPISNAIGAVHIKIIALVKFPDNLAPTDPSGLRRRQRAARASPKGGTVHRTPTPNVKAAAAALAALIVRLIFLF